jgi:hypothetical protein
MGRLDELTIIGDCGDCTPGVKSEKKEGQGQASSLKGKSQLSEGLTATPLGPFAKRLRLLRPGCRTSRYHGRAVNSRRITRP